MYNLSATVTETLQEYLRFDPKELEVGLWSGTLDIHDVAVRDEVRRYELVVDLSARETEVHDAQFMVELLTAFDALIILW